MVANVGMEPMRLWQPAPGEAELAAWWAPLVLVSRAVRRERIAWSVYVDEFTLVGRVDRLDLPAVWIYQHRASRGCIQVDEHGHPYRYVKPSQPAMSGSFERIDLSACVHAAHLPDVVEPVTYERSGPAWLHGRGPAAVEPDEPDGRDGADDPVRRRPDRSRAAHPANRRRPPRTDSGRRWLHAVPSAEPA